MGVAGWSGWAAAGGGAGGTPLWVTMLVAAIALVGPVLAYLASRRNTVTVRTNALEANETANRAIQQDREVSERANAMAQQTNSLLHEREVTKLGADWIAAAEVMLASSDRRTRGRAYIRLEAVAKTKDLPKSLAEWIAELMATREPEDELKAARAIKAGTGEGTTFFMDTDVPGDDDGGEEV